MFKCLTLEGSTDKFVVVPEALDFSLRSCVYVACLRVLALLTVYCAA